MRRKVLRREEGWNQDSRGGRVSPEEGGAIWVQRWQHLGGLEGPLLQSFSFSRRERFFVQMTWRSWLQERLKNLRYLLWIMKMSVSQGDAGSSAHSAECAGELQDQLMQGLHFLHRPSTAGVGWVSRGLGPAGQKGKVNSIIQRLGYDGQRVILSDIFSDQKVLMIRNCYHSQFFVLSQQSLLQLNSRQKRCEINPGSCRQGC